MEIFLWDKLDRHQRKILLKRPDVPLASSEQVAAIMTAVEQGGPQVLADFCQRFDDWSPNSANPIELPPERWPKLGTQLDPRLKTVLDRAHRNLSKFHANQGLVSYRQSNSPGLSCERRVSPLQRVGLYIPGGSAPLFSTMLMLGVPAQLAKVDQLVVCSPTPKGEAPHPALLYCAQLCGVKEFYRLGGAQAIAAMAGGGKLMEPVVKICGPGNAYVTAAKQMLAQRYPAVAIDMPAGPSELMLVADQQADPCYLAADALSQAEHDPLAQVLLVSNSAQILQQAAQQMQLQISQLPRQQVTMQALTHCRLILTSSLEQAMEVANLYGPEHLSLAVEEKAQVNLLALVRHAGSVFLGHLSAEAFGDYLSGTNHVLPTAGGAHSYSGVTVETFQRSFTVQKVNRAALVDLGPSVAIFARAEGLEAHARAVELRLERGNANNREAG